MLQILEEGVAVDKDGNETINPSEAQTLIGIGKYKGFALASMVEVLCSTLSGMPYGPHIPSMYGSSIKTKRKLGQFYLVFRNDVNINSNEFMKSLKKMSDEVRDQIPKSNKCEVLMPNDPQIKNAKERLKNGIPVMDKIIDIISEV